MKTKEGSLIMGHIHSIETIIDRTPIGPGSAELSAYGKRELKKLIADIEYQFSDRM